MELHAAKRRLQRFPTPGALALGAAAALAPAQTGVAA
jgi:hypothetical protein